MPESATSFEIRDRLVAGLKASGWQVVASPTSNPASATVHATKGNRDLWADLGVSFADDIDVRLLEVAPVPLKLTLKPPAAKPEPTPGEKDHCPFFTPLPGSIEVSGVNSS
jgi:hypothetical protein